MSQSAIEPDIGSALASLEAELAHAPTAARLRALRNLLDDATFLRQMRELLQRRHNDPQIYEIPNTVVRIMRKVEEYRDEREFHRALVTTMAAGGGTALIVGSIMAGLNPLVGGFALVPAAVGVWSAGVAWIAGGRLDKERILYKQIAERLAAIIKAME